MLRGMGILVGAGIIGAGAAAAQQPAGEGSAVNLGSIVVSAPLGLSRSDIVEGTTVLDGDALERNRGLTLGDTLGRTPGVAATGYGPGASRPVIRGQGGPRIRTLQNGIDSFDASTVSPDHAVAAPLSGAERIEVLRGPATLLYGSGAIGGVVNVIDGRIPDRMPKGGVSGTGRLEYGTAARDLTGFGSIDTALGSNFVMHADGYATNAGDYTAGGGIGKIENSFVRLRGGSVGASWLGERAYAGLSVARFATKYGIPSGGHTHAGEEEEGHDHEHEEEAAERVTIDMRQTRWDAKFGVYDPIAGIAELRGRIGYGEYRHTELEDGVPDTTFRNRSWEGRLEAAHTPIGGISGVVGVQGGRRDFKVTGDEAFAPPTVTETAAVFVLEKYEAGPWLLTAGARLERTSVTPSGVDRERSFTGTSFSAGATYRLDEAWSLGASLSRTERAPSAEELFADGPHAGTASFEIGDPNLRKEQAWTAEVSLRKRRGDVTGGVNLFASRYRNFIFPDFTGQVADGLDVLQYRQADADFRGVELEAAWTFLRGAGWSMAVDGHLDYVRAENRSTGTPLPRIPPLGYLFGVSADLGQLTLRGEVEGRARQGRTAPDETETGGYTFLNASIGWRPLPDSDDLLLRIEGRNLTDAAGRNHVSFLKDVAPLRGREIRLVGQVRF
ncbi:MAG: TonB-dependent receptor [Alphaproteobacteria bacterium]